MFNTLRAAQIKKQDSSISKPTSTWLDLTRHDLTRLQLTRLLLIASDALRLPVRVDLQPVDPIKETGTLRSHNTLSSQRCLLKWSRNLSVSVENKPSNVSVLSHHETKRKTPSLVQTLILKLFPPQICCEATWSSCQQLVMTVNVICYFYSCM